MDIDIVKGGQSVILATIGRPAGKLAKAGVCLTVSVRVHSSVEDFMAGMSAEEPVSSTLFGRPWIPIDRPLQIYSLPQEMGGIQNPGGDFAYRLDKPCNNLLLTDADRGTPVVNLSFLRIAGIGEGSGVTFGIKGLPVRTNTLRDLRDRISGAARHFYRDFMKPVDVSIAVVLQEFERPLLVSQDIIGE